MTRFLAHLAYQPKSRKKSCFVHRRRQLVSLASASVHTSPSHRIKPGNFIFGTDMHLYSLYMHVNYLVILMYSCYVAAILEIFFDGYTANIDSHTDTSYCTHVYIHSTPAYAKRIRSLFHIFRD